MPRTYLEKTWAAIKAANNNIISIATTPIPDTTLSIDLSMN